MPAAREEAPACQPLTGSQVTPSPVSRQQDSRHPPGRTAAQAGGQKRKTSHRGQAQLVEQAPGVRTHAHRTVDSTSVLHPHGLAASQAHLPSIAGQADTAVRVPGERAAPGPRPDMEPGLRCVLGRVVMSSSLQPHALRPARLLCPCKFPGTNTAVGCHF